MEILSERPVDMITEEIAARTEPGRGEKILWLHGYTLDSSTWGKLWRLLPDWHHIGIDLPGHGSSAPIEDKSNIRDLGRNLGELCKDQGIEHLVALSFGTITAIQIAIELPDHFKSITLGAPALAGGPQDPEMAKTYSKLIFLYKMAGATQALNDLWLSCPAWQGMEKQPGLKREIAEIVSRHSWAELESFSKMQQFFSPPQKEADLATIVSPVSVIIGEHEMPAFKEVAQILKRNLSSYQEFVLPGAYHLCLLQSPEESSRIISEQIIKK